ncbi:MAG: hypothetical protein GEU82_02475 [Luteitalea sp.]|nr:hypothetical protein [Luteitalea sp.]
MSAGQDRLSPGEPSGTRDLPKGRERLLKLIALTIGSILAALIGEVTLRLLAPTPDTARAVLPDSERHFGYPGHFRGFAGGVAFQTNDAGFRGRDFASIDGTRDHVILVIGDSYAFGYGVDDADAFPAVLEANLAQQYPGKAIRVVALAMPGYNTRQQLATLKEYGPRLRPRLVLIAYNLNDIHQREADEAPPDEAASETAADPGWNLRPRRLIDSARERSHLVRFLLPQVAALARAAHLAIETAVTAEVHEYVADGPAWKDNQLVLLQTIDYARTKLGAEVGLMVVPYVVQLTERHPPATAYDAVMKFSASHGVPAVNAFDYFLGHRAGALWINLFDAHPNATGHALMAQAASDLLVRGGLLETPVKLPKTP